MMDEVENLHQQNDRMILLGQMAAAAIHEIKNPLAVIKGFCQIICTVTKEDSIKNYVEHIDNEVERINRVVTCILTFAKPFTGVKREITVGELIESIKYNIDTNSFIKGVNTKYCLVDSGIKIMADADLLRQVILNIVQNGIEAMAKTTCPCMKISTGWDKSTDEAYITITNNGEPIPPQNMVKLGSPFFTTKEKGTGLGLNISYNIIRQHGGRIIVDSGENRETSFTFFYRVITVCRKGTNRVCWRDIM